MSSISSRSLSMSSLIFLPFLASSGLPAAPSPPSAGLVGRVSFFFCCSAIAPSLDAFYHSSPAFPGQRRKCLRSEEHTSELQSRGHLVCRLLLEKKIQFVH